MTPGYHHGTVYVSTVPVNASTGVEYGGGGQAVLWALDASTGAPEWRWDEVQGPVGEPGHQLRRRPVVRAVLRHPGQPLYRRGQPRPAGRAPGYPWGTGRPGPRPAHRLGGQAQLGGKLLWYYQLTPHDLYDWDLQDPPVLTTANGRPVVIDGGKAGILVELNAQTGKLLWKRPVGVHNGHDHDGPLAENATPTSRLALPAQVDVEPGAFGGIESQLASNGSVAFAAVNDLPVVFKSESGPWFPSLAALGSAVKRPPVRWSRSTRTPAGSWDTRPRPPRTAPRR